MSRIAPLITGGAAAGVAITLGAIPPVAAGAALGVAVLHSGRIRRQRWKRYAADQKRRATVAEARLSESQRAFGEVESLAAQLAEESEQATAALTRALNELERRDQVGTPAARELMSQQDRALTAQQQALEEARSLIAEQRSALLQQQQALGRGDDIAASTIERLEQLLAIQIEQSMTLQHDLLDRTSMLQQHMAEGQRDLQRSVSQLLERLAMTPRHQAVTVNDSVWWQQPGQPPVPAPTSAPPAAPPAGVAAAGGPPISVPGERMVSGLPVAPIIEIEPILAPGSLPPAEPAPSTDPWVQALREDLG